MDGNTLNMTGWTFVDWGGQDELITVFGDNDDENIWGSSQFDMLIGNGGNDLLEGNEGRDNLQGGSGNDRLDGGTGEDWMFGGPGDDTYYVDESLDYIDEGVAFPALPGGGIDTLYSSAAWYYESNFTIENLFIYAMPYHTTLVAGGNANTIHGSSGDNNIYVNWGDDIVYAGPGLDHIDLTDRSGGASGANTIMFEPGNGYDILWNYAPDIDKVNLAPFGLADYAALSAFGHDDGVGNCYFALGPTGTDYLYFVGLELADMVAGDFIFA
jgi:Ca2+-binding RTX toxin-like protein